MKNSWDKIMLITLAVVTLALAGWFVMKALAFSEKFTLPQGVADNSLPNTEEDIVKDATGNVQKTLNWNLPLKDGRSLPLFISIPIVEKDGRLWDLTKPGEDTFLPPVSNQWLLEHKLDILNPNILTLDSDQDGYTNLEEWTGQTNPQDPNSHPPYTDKLSFKERTSEDYKVLFAARPDQTRFQIRRLPTEKWPRQASWFLGIGEESDDGQIRLDSFEEKQAQNQLGINVDASVLTITFLPKDNKVSLIRNIAETIPTYFVSFDFALGSSEIRVKEGESFVLPQDPNTKYQLITPNENSAVLSFKTPDGESKTVEIIKKK